MNAFVNQLRNSAVAFVKDEEGAQVIEYALIIALVSISLALALKGLTDAGGGFTTFITRVSNCLTGGTCS